MTLCGPEEYRPSVVAASASGNHLHRIGPEEPAAVRHTAIPPGSHPSSQDGAAACWETASAHALVQVVVGRRGDVVSACPGGVAFEACGAPAHDGPAVRHPCQTAQVLDLSPSGASGCSINQIHYLP